MKNFMLLDKNNNLQKNAIVIVKFKFEEKEYLVYSIDENEQNCQIFVSKLILNSEGKYFIDYLSTEEKGKLSNIVYNIVILLPNEVQKGLSFNELQNILKNKFSVDLSVYNIDLALQEYYSSCSIAITSKILVESSIKLYSDNLKDDSGQEQVLTPIWTAPATVTAPIPTAPEENAKLPTSGVTSFISVQEPLEAPQVNTVLNTVVQPTENQVTTSVPEPAVPISNSQVEKLAIVSDPSLGINVNQSSLDKNKKAGYANTKYIVMGTVCLVLSLAVVIGAYFLITNMS